MGEANKIRANHPAFTPELWQKKLYAEVISTGSLFLRYTVPNEHSPYSYQPSPLYLFVLKLREARRRIRNAWLCLRYGYRVEEE